MDKDYKHKYNKYKCKYTKLKQIKIKHGGSNGNAGNTSQSELLAKQYLDNNNTDLTPMINLNNKKLPIVEIYEYEIDNYTKVKNKFKGFESSFTCSSISVEKAAESISNNNNNNN